MIRSGIRQRRFALLASASGTSLLAAALLVAAPRIARPQQAGAPTAPAPPTPPAEGGTEERETPPAPFDRRAWDRVTVDEKRRMIEQEARRIFRETGERPPSAVVTGEGEAGIGGEAQSAARAIEWDAAPTIETEHYRIRSNAPADAVRRYAQTLERFFARFCRVFRFDQRLQRKCDIWIYATKDEFMRLESTPETVGGFYSPGERRVVTYHGRFGMTGDTVTVLAHEGTHQFEHLIGPAIFQHAPVWVTEGLACFFEAARVTDEGVDIGAIPRDRLAVVQRAFRSGEAVPLRELIRIPQPEFNGFHYAHAWALTYWFVYTNRNNRELFDRFFQRCLRGPVTAEDFEQSIGVTIEELESHWRDWVLALDPANPPSRED